jgi:hypothetical protein
MGRANGKSYIEEMKIRGKERYEKNGGKNPKILQWKDLPKKVKKKVDKYTKKAK